MTALLEDIRVIAVEQYGAGPFGTLQLADLGADVIKIEDPSAGGDTARFVPPYQEGEHSLFFESFNRNKRSLALDLRIPEARPVFERLVKHADVVVSNLRGDQAEKLGLRYADLEHVNPTIVCVSLSGFGATGPRREFGAYDYTIQGLAGWQSITGEPDGPPTKSGLSLVDMCGGYVAAIAMLAGVHAARRDGVGRDFDLSLFEVALAQLTYLGTWVASRGYEPVRRAHSAHQSVVPFQNLMAKDGWIVVACPKESLWRRFCGVIGHPELVTDERFARFADRDRNREDLVPLLNEILGSGTVREWCDAFDAAGVPAGPVNTIGDAFLEPQAQARGSIVETDHPVLGVVRHIRSPFSSAIRAGRGPFLGEHTDGLLHELGLPEGERRGGSGTSGSSATVSERVPSLTDMRAPKEWRGRFFEDIEVGDVYRSRIGRTITETDNTWFTLLTMNTNQVHFNTEFAARTEFERPLIVSTLTLAIVLGLSVADTSENALANLGWNEIRLPKPVFAGDTLWAETEVTAVRESKSRSSCGIVAVRTRGINQRREVVIEFTRSFMLLRRNAAEVRDAFPGTDGEWGV